MHYLHSSQHRLSERLGGTNTGMWQMLVGITFIYPIYNWSHVFLAGDRQRSPIDISTAIESETKKILLITLSLYVFEPHTVLDGSSNVSSKSEKQADSRHEHCRVIMRSHLDHWASGRHWLTVGMWVLAFQSILDPDSQQNGGLSIHNANRGNSGQSQAVGSRYEIIPGTPWVREELLHLCRRKMSR
jgi:hypothetical protein